MTENFSQDFWGDFIGTINCQPKGTKLIHIYKDYKSEIF